MVRMADPGPVGPHHLLLQLVLAYVWSLPDHSLHLPPEVLHAIEGQEVRLVIEGMDDRSVRLSVRAVADG